MVVGVDKPDVEGVSVAIGDELDCVGASWKLYHCKEVF
jgi:hypothetical protein